MKFILFSLFSFMVIKSSAQELVLLAGTYTSGKSHGIYVYEFDALKGTATLLDSVASSNPSYLAVAPGQLFVYGVNENDGGKVSAFATEKNGSLRLLNQQSSEGDHPCYITTDKAGKWAVVGNYSSGTVAVLPVLEDGSLGAAVSVKQHEGNSVTERQQSPHVHAAVFSEDDRFLFVPDLGIDKIMIYSFNNDTGELEPAPMPFFEMEPGAGPRHFVIHPNHKWAYIVEELSGKVTAFNLEEGRLQAKQSISTLPEDFSGDNTSADIHISADGRFLYASNRGTANSIAVFSIDEGEGTLSLQGHQSTLGLTPRNFILDPADKFLLVANQNSNEIVIFERDKNTGLLEDSGQRIKVEKPVCLKWMLKN